MEPATFEHDQNDPLFPLKEKTATRFGTWISEIHPELNPRPIKMTKEFLSIFLVKLGIVPKGLKVETVNALQHELVAMYKREFELCINNSDESWEQRESKPERPRPISKASSRASSRGSRSSRGDSDDEWESLADRGYPLTSIPCVPRF